MSLIFPNPPQTLDPFSTGDFFQWQGTFGTSPSISTLPLGGTGTAVNTSPGSLATFRQSIPRNVQTQAIANQNFGWFLGNACATPRQNGFVFNAWFGIESVRPAGSGFLCGVADVAGISSIDVNPLTTLANNARVGVGYDAADVTWKICTKQATGIASTVVDTQRAITIGEMLKLTITASSTQVVVKVEAITGFSSKTTVINQTFTTNIPPNTIYMGQRCMGSNGAVGGGDAFLYKMIVAVPRTAV